MIEKWWKVTCDRCRQSQRAEDTGCPGRVIPKGWTFMTAPGLDPYERLLCPDCIEAFVKWMKKGQP